MDKKLQLVAHLYDEEVEGLEPLGSLLADPELRSEYEALSETRFRLERRTRVRPDAQTIDRLVLKAVSAAAAGRADRLPLRLVRSSRMWLPAMTLAASILVVVLVRPWDTETRVQLGKAETAQLAVSDTPAESLLGTLPPPVPVVLASDMGATDTEWDTGDDIRQLSRRIAALRLSGVDAWDGPAVPLEAIPESHSGDLLSPAGASRPRF